MFKNPEQAREVDTLDHALCEAEIMLQGLDAFDRRQSVLARRGAAHPMSASMMKLLLTELQQEIAELGVRALGLDALRDQRSEEHTSELQSLMRISYAVFCLKKKNKID